MSGHGGRFRSWHALAALAATVSFGIAGCSSSTHSGSTTTTSGRSGSVTVNTPDGTASLSLDGQLPPNWPTDFPVPPGATPAGSGSIGNSSTTHHVAVFRSDGSGQDAYNFYKSSSSLTVSDAKSVGTGSAFAGRMHISGSYTGSVTVTEVNDQTLIVVNITAATKNGAPVPGAR